MAVSDFSEELTPGADWVWTLLRLTGAHLLTLTGGATGGYWTLTRGGVITGHIDPAAGAPEMQTAMDLLFGVGQTTVTATGPGGPWVIHPASVLATDPYALQTWLNTVVGTPDLTHLTGGSAYHLADAPQPLDITGWTYALRARHDPASGSPDLEVTSTLTSGNQITIVGPSGQILVHVTGTTTAGLDFGAGVGKAAAAAAVLFESNGTYTLPITRGALTLRNRV